MAPVIRMVLLAFLLAASSAAQAQLTMHISHSTYEDVNLHSLLDGSGQSLSEATGENGQTVDATIYVTLRFNGAILDVNDVSLEDVYIVDGQGRFGKMCRTPARTFDWAFRAWVFDGPVNAAGEMTGLSFEAEYQGHYAYNADWLSDNIRMNSADTNYDGSVNLSDVQTFAEAYYGTPPTAFFPEAYDYNFDGVVDASDLTILAQSLGPHDCW